MKRFIIPLLFVAFVSTVRAVAPVPFTVGTSFSFRVAGVGGGIMTVYDENGAPSLSHGHSVSNTSESGMNIAWLRPGRQYRVNFQASGPSEYWLSFTPPDGYAVHVGGVESNIIHYYTGGGQYSHDYYFDLRPVGDNSPAELGAFSGIQVGNAISWSVGLSGLNTGRTAGRIVFRELDFSNDPASRSRLYYSAQPNAGQISVIKDGPSNQTLRQILVPQGIVDLVDASNGYWMYFYTWPQASWNGSIWTFSGSPWKSIRVESPAADTLKITESENGVSRVSELVLTSGSNSIVASGGTVSTVNGYKIHTFTSSGTFTVSSAPSGQTMEVLVVGGGGGGGGTAVNGGGGGGGGGVVIHNSLAPSVGSYTVTVGAGGAGGATGANGGNSAFGSMTALGGGGGGTYGALGSNGGSGGGSGRDQGSWSTSSATQGNSAGGTGYGSAGGAAPYGGYGDAGGGGGAGGAGGYGLQTYGPLGPGPGGGNGGNGIASAITGTSVYYGGGGGGASENREGGDGGLGGGGHGNGYGSASTAGSPNTGGGGGGGQTSWVGHNAPGQPGGSGIVVVRYPSGVATGNYAWRLREGNGSTWLRTVTYDSVKVSGGREATVVVRTDDVSGPVVGKTKYVFANQAWGEELSQVINDPDTHALTTTYTYHTSVPTLGSETHRGNYRRVKSVTAPTGAWTVYEYYDDWNRRGQLKYRYEPYVDSPSTAAGASTTSGKVTFFDYTADWTGRHTRPTVREERINNVVTGRTTWTHGDITGSGQPRESATTVAYASASLTHTGSSQNYRADANLNFANTPYFVKAADERQVSYGTSNGWFNHSTRQFAINSGGADWMQMAFHGSTNSSGATLVSSHAGLSFEPVYLVPNKSTLEVRILNNAGLLLRTETHVYSGGSSFHLVSWEDFTYNAEGRLVQRLASNGALTTYGYWGGRLSFTETPDGTRTEYAYDLIGRLATQVRKGASGRSAILTGGYSYPAQGDIVTTYTYNGLNRVVQEVTTGGSNSVTSTRQFDLAGRVTQEVAFAGSSHSLPTSYSYSAGGKIVTTTLPGGGTRTFETHLDGQVKSVHGSAAITENYAYWIDSGSGYRARQAVFGGNYSAWTNSGWDWLGRLTDEWAPRWDGNAWGKVSHYNAKGQLWKFTQPGVAPTLFEYNTLGERVRTGLDLNGNNVLDVSGSDRIATSDVSFYHNGSTWWLRSQTGTYATASSGTHTVLSDVYEQLTSLSANVHKNTHAYDFHGNVTVSYTHVDRGNKTVQFLTDTPDSNINAVLVTYNGLAAESRDSAGITHRSEYDPLGRVWKTIDPRKGATTTAYHAGTNLVSTVTDPASNVQATYAYDSAGRVFSVKNALNKYVYTTYNSRGQLFRRWGDTAYPVEYGYNNLGQQTSMKTFRGGSGWTGSTWPASPGTADTTTWTFHAPTNLLQSKTDAGGKAVSYTYTVAGQIARRTWARGVQTNYSYDGNTGDLTFVDYSDGTPDVTYTYNRLGQIATVTDYTGTRTLTHNAAGRLTQETLGSLLQSRTLSYQLATSGVLGRLNGYTLSGASGSGTDLAVAYGYRSDGRLDHVASGKTFTYGYVSGSHLVESVTESTAGFSSWRSYLAHRDIMQYNNSTTGATTVATFQQFFDPLGRMTYSDKSGAIFSRYSGGALVTAYGYNDRSEVTSEKTFLGWSSTILSGRDDSYAYDHLGNRTTATHNGNAATYTTNALNQYTQRTVPGVFDVSGAAGTGATVTVNGSSSGVVRHGEYFFKGHPLSNGSNPVYTNLTVSDGTTSTNVPAFLAKTPEGYTYDDDGNLLTDGRWGYWYDAENRPYWMQTTAAAVGAGHPNQAYQFFYDYLGRRIRKIDYSWNGSNWVAGTERRFIYEGWNLIGEYAGPYNGGNFPTGSARHFLWGKDLSGTVHGAGGVGGLLMTKEAGESYLAAYDTMGNVHAMIRASDRAIVAAYEYDAFGRTIRESGPYAAQNPFRFSTKYADVETGLIYYGLRYYNPSMGRFINRDPLGERGGLNLYAFVGNSGVNRADLLGLTPILDNQLFDKDGVPINRWETPDGLVPPVEENSEEEWYGGGMFGGDEFIYGFDGMAMYDNFGRSLGFTSSEMLFSTYAPAFAAVQLEQYHLSRKAEAKILEAKALGDEPGRSAPNSAGLIAASGSGMYTDGSIPYVTQGGEAGAAGRNGVPATGITLTQPRNTVAAITFDGSTMTINYYSGGTQGFPATSGRPGVTNPAIRDQGPIPPGVYMLNSGDITPGGFLRSLTGDWGAYRVPLSPVPGTDTFGRDGFFLHGGTRPGSAGCIDCGRADVTVFPILQRQPDPVPVIVTYPPTN